MYMEHTRKREYQPHPTPSLAARARSYWCVYPPLDFATYADIDDNTINNCGLWDFVYGDGQNGEGICE